jgi:AcrR family transcriptional regulator
MNNRKPKKASGEKRREAIMETAWGLFLEKGYAAVSVDEIISKSGGSKSTVYDFFGSKEGLFLELVSSITKKILGEMQLPDITGQSTKEALTRICRASASHVLSEKGIELYRLAVSESKRFPRIGRLFFDAGPGHTQQGLAYYLAKETSAGRLRIKNPRLAAEFLLGMLLMCDHLAMSVGCATLPSKARINGVVDEAVDVFMAAYGV